MILVTVQFHSPPDRVWRELADLGSHAEWMSDAETVRFVTEQKTGVGTRFIVPTRIGPFRTSDLITVVEWKEGTAIAVVHLGRVSGLGRFEIRPASEGTELRWTETLHFPWWLGGRVGAWLAEPILTSVWQGNLRRLGDRLALSDP